MRLLRLCLLSAVLSACGGGTAPAPEAIGAGSMAAQRSQAQDAGQLSGSQTVRGRIFGLGGVVATVTLGDQARVLRTAQTSADGQFEFTNVPYGNYFVKAEATGLTLSPAQLLTVNPPTVLTDFGMLRQVLPGPAGVVFTVANQASGSSSFHWDNISGGQESLAHINQPPVIQYRNETITPPDTAAAATLFARYGVVLSDAGVKWTHEHASRLLATLGSLPTRLPGNDESKPFRISKWVLTDQALAEDIAIERAATGDSVSVSSAAFVYATPRLVYLDGVPGRFFSKRLHHAVLHFATMDGNDRDAAENILTQRFGVATRLYDNRHLRAGETASDFSTFRPEELIDLINTFEEMPEGFYKIPSLQFLVRRADGRVHPLDKNIIAQANTGQGYIEFTDVALRKTATLSPYRVILHEKSHFLWASVLSAGQRSDWTALGGWSRNPLDASKWLSNSPIGFVSTYAHDNGPDEDLAESIADYIINPALLQSRAVEKFNFIKQRIFHGDQFVPVIRSDLTFTVVDLVPDYTAPGKIKSIDLQLSGAPTEWKFGKMTIELFGDASPSAGAAMCILQFLPPSGKREHFMQTQVYAMTAPGQVDLKKNSTTLSAGLQFSPHAESGYWVLRSIKCTDVTGNSRELSGSDVGGAAIYVNNALKTTEDLKYEANSLSIVELAPTLVEGRSFKRVQVSWRLEPHQVPLSHGMATLFSLDYFNVFIAQGGLADYNAATRTLTAIYLVPDYYASGRFGITTLSTWDAAFKRADTEFPIAKTGEAVHYINLVNARPDGAPPELDLNRITVSATPTKPAAPDGETTVNIAIYTRDDVSGLNAANFTLLSPQGELTQVYFHTNNTLGALENSSANYSYFYRGDPTVWQRHEATITLPVGSAPGTWGVQWIELRDKAGFAKWFNFGEIVHFVVSGK